jgi:hypothetical protein
MIEFFFLHLAKNKTLVNGYQKHTELPAPLIAKQQQGMVQ